MKDSYQLFFDGYLSKDQLFEFGLENSIFVDRDLVARGWSQLKNSIISNQEVHIRSYGRNGHGTHMFKSLYKEVFGNDHIIQDPTNNASPKRVIQQLTGYRVNRDLRNFQIAHVFGRTKNPYAFTAPWNIAFIPKIIDPFTGHEAKGGYVEEYQKLFTDKVFDMFGDFIEEFNEISTSNELTEKISSYLDGLKNAEVLTEAKFNGFSVSVLSEFKPIQRLLIDEHQTLDEGLMPGNNDENTQAIAIQPSIRQRASFWLQAKGLLLNSFRSSRYLDNTAQYDWWFTVRKDRDLSDIEGSMSLLCEKPESMGEFYYLSLPNKFVLESFAERRADQNLIEIRIKQNIDGQLLVAENDINLMAYVQTC